MLAAIERHVLEKMGEALLVILLVQGARFDQKPQRRALFRLLVGPHHIANAVGQGAMFGGRVQFKVARFMWKRNRSGGRREEECKAEGEGNETAHVHSPAKGHKRSKRKNAELIFFAPLAPFCGLCQPGFQMLWLYRLLFIPALILLAPGYLLRMRKRGGYSENFMQRFGVVRGLPERAAGRIRVWLQAVSVGEMLAIGPILTALHRDGVEVYLTTTTSTGYRLAQERFRGLVAGIGYFPIDWWPFVARAWRAIAPDLMILTEGERWPEHLHEANWRSVPVVCVNARLSDRSFSRLKNFRAGSRLMLEGVTRLLAASADDAARFSALGLAPERIVITGNIKLDVEIPILTDDERRVLRAALGLPDGFVVLGSSTWPGEEDALVAALQRVRAVGVRCSVLIVPRHAERRAEIERTLANSGLRFHLRSRGNANGEVDVAVADTTGELRRLTQLADLVFVGKSLPPHTEGQTPVEAAALQKPILFGPGMSNFRVITKDLLARGARRGRTRFGVRRTSAGCKASIGPRRCRGKMAGRECRRGSAYAPDNRGRAVATQAMTRMCRFECMPRVVQLAFGNYAASSGLHRAPSFLRSPFLD